MILEKFPTNQNDQPKPLRVASILIQSLSRMPEHLGSSNLPFEGRQFALPLFTSIRDIAFDGWGRIHSQVKNPAQFTLVLEIDHDGRTFEFILHRDAINGDSVSFVGYGYVTCFLEHKLFTDTQVWQNEIAALFLDNYAKYMPQLKKVQPQG